MSTVMLVEMLVVISIVSSLVVALVAAMVLIIYRHELTYLHDDSFLYSLGVAGDTSPLEDRLRRLPWVIGLKTEPGPVDVSGNLTTTLFVQVTDPRKAERELPRIALDDGHTVVSAYRQGTHDWGATYMPTPQVGARRERAAGFGRRSEHAARLSGEPRTPSVTAPRVEKPGAA